MPAGAAEKRQSEGEAPTAGGECRHHPARADACFWIHGRLSAWNGAPTFRIAWSGTNRVLGIAAPGWENGVLMPPLAYSHARMGADMAVPTIDGDWLVCPFTTDTPGRMRMACIEEGRNLVIEKRPMEPSSKAPPEVQHIGPRGEAVPPGRSLPSP